MSLTQAPADPRRIEKARLTQKWVQKDIRIEKAVPNRKAVPRIECEASTQTQCELAILGDDGQQTWEHKQTWENQPAWQRKRKRTQF